MGSRYRSMPGLLWPLRARDHISLGCQALKPLKPLAELSRSPLKIVPVSLWTGCLGSEQIQEPAH
jgi:hypothetical protein